MRPGIAHDQTRGARATAAQAVRRGAPVAHPRCRRRARPPLLRWRAPAWSCPCRAARPAARPAQGGSQGGLCWDRALPPVSLPAVRRAVPTPLPLPHLTSGATQAPQMGGGAIAQRALGTPPPVPPRPSDHPLGQAHTHLGQLAALAQANTHEHIHTLGSLPPRPVNLAGSRRYSTISSSSALASSTPFTSANLWLARGWGAWVGVGTEWCVVSRGVPRAVEAHWWQEGAVPVWGP